MLVHTLLRAPRESHLPMRVPARQPGLRPVVSGIPAGISDRVPPWWDESHR